MRCTLGGPAVFVTAYVSPVLSQVFRRSASVMVRIAATAWHRSAWQHVDRSVSFFLEGNEWQTGISEIRQQCSVRGKCSHSKQAGIICMLNSAWKYPLGATYCRCKWITLYIWYINLMDTYPTMSFALPSGPGPAGPSDSRTHVLSCYGAWPTFVLIVFIIVIDLIWAVASHLHASNIVSTCIWCKYFACPSCPHAMRHP